jgi:hypothetical protein
VTEAFGATDSDEDVEIEVRAYTSAHPCDKIVILELVDEERRQAQHCPHCQGALTWLKNGAGLDRFPTCVVPTCTQYLSTAANSDTQGRCVGDRTDKAGRCNRKLDTIAPGDVELYVYGDNEQGYADEDPGAVRRLKSRMADARAFIRSSGTHHASKGGSHTKGAREKHSRASKSKAFVRNYYVDELQARITAVESLPNGAKTYAALLTDARRAVKEVENK